MEGQIVWVNYWLGVGTLALEVFLFLGVCFWVFLKFYKNEAASLLVPILNFSQKTFGWLGDLDRRLIFKIFVLSLVASFLTLYYSEVLGIEPCALCWFGRVFLYGILILSTTALFVSDKRERQVVFRYIKVFTILGVAVSLYHHFLQMSLGLVSSLPCPAGGVDCAKRIIFEFGHITFPWMAFVLFMLIYIMIKLFEKIQAEEQCATK